MRSTFRKTRWNRPTNGAIVPNPRRRPRVFAFYGVLVLAVAAVAGFGLRSIYGSASASTSIARTVTVQRGTVQESVTASGNISPAAADSENFTGSGTVTAVKVTVGDQVRAGEVLATLDPTTARANLQSAEASLLGAETTLQQALQGGSPSQVAQNKSSLSSAQAQLASDDQQLTTDETALSAAEAQLADDEALGCPPSSSSSSSSGGSGSGGGTSGGAGSTTASAPTAVTSSATSVTTTTAELQGSVSPNGAQATYYFEYGTTTSYSSRTTSGTVGAGTSTPVAVSVSGLDPATSYIFRLVASNSKGTSYSLPQYLTTATSSCVTDQKTIASDEQTVQNQQQTIQLQQANVAAIEAGQALDPVTIAQARAAVTQSQLTVTSDKKALRGTVLTASIGGVVTAVNGAVGDTESGSGSGSSGSGSSGSGSSGSGSSGSSGSSSSTAFITIDNLKSLEVVAGFAEADATKIAVGQPATVTLAALPSTEVAGEVTAISPTSVVTSNVVTYDETISLRNPPSDVLDGMTADVSVVVATATNVLEVPSAAVTTTGLFSTVTVLKNGAQVTTRVTVGLVGNSTTQILSGVTAGEELIEPTATVSPSTTGSTGSTRTFGGGGGGGGGIFGGGGGVG
ncbi:MAG TPA: efflux RND transporter periplasmic adaptor subunit [Acidimicrobiales bacterium]|nr:efflux RND transporter periplasmic adaptor subunit [Acidimicrobiales bacterium]